ncbi:GntR family transcriptional regulator [Pseudooceanicola nanhaiensis]|uniref:GntR family transcriptional regulator n=1 Tax=Pseudooceanicola nanhaiensis TaxID=375761 RepID=UPI001CD40872|nr:GntR family transcriptional regulator [Pseudooceanicola nanhaiensis]MCA0921246.1 GntR family transcriptional regulator [Pseudooceanicola nanhaiensis]
MRKETSEITDIVRSRICQRAEQEDMILHEGMLATEFGVSRTPIRQVLQKLAYEHLVETRSGIGTIVSPLLPEQRPMDFAVFRSLLRGAGECASDVPLPDLDATRLATVQRQAAAPEDRIAPVYFSQRSELLEILSQLVSDRILADALRAAHWRHLRWRMRDLADTPEPVVADWRATMAAVPAEPTRRQLMLALADAPF